MSLACFRQNISLKTSIVAICVTVLITIVGLQVWLSVYRSKMDGDTPEICRLYLEQNAFVHAHFGELHEEKFIQDESATLTRDQTSGTLGLYTFRVSGSKAIGILKMVWTREMGAGALTVSAIKITNECPLSKPVSDGVPKKAKPRSSVLPGGVLAIGF